MKQHILILAGLVTVAAAGFGMGRSPAPLESETQYRAVELVEVSGEEYAVEIRGENRTTVEVALYTTEPRRIEIDESGDRLRIEVKRRVFGFLRPLQSGRIVLAVPNNTSVSVGTASGAIALQDLSQSRTLAASTASGAVSIRGSQGEPSVRTASGAVRIEETAGTKSVRSSSGAGRIENSTGNVEARTGSGAPRYSAVQGSISARSTSGAVRLTDTRGSLQVKSTSGAIQGDRVDLTDDSIIESTSGRVSLDLSNDFDDLRIAGQSVSGRVRIGSTSGRDVTFGSGQTELTIRTVSGGQEVN